MRAAQGSSSRHPASATADALGLLARRELSAAQVRARLRQRGYSSDTIEDALGKLRDQGAVDDRRVAVAYARRDRAIKHYGPARILLRLSSIGIDGETAKHAVHEVFGEGDEHSTLAHAFERRVKAGRVDLHDPVGQRRIHQHLVRRGFSAGSVSSFLRSRMADRTNSADDGDE